jgi:hypothetical protein
VPLDDALLLFDRDTGWNALWLRCLEAEAGDPLHPWRP